jgi:hypothetical protein
MSLYGDKLIHPVASKLPTTSTTSSPVTPNTPSLTSTYAISELTKTSVITKHGIPSTVSDCMEISLVISISQIITAIATSLNSPPNSSLSGSEKTGIVVGSALGGFAFILMLLATTLICRRYRRREAIRIQKAIPTPRKIRLEDEDELDLSEPGLTFLRLEHPLKPGELNLSSIVEDVMGHSHDDLNDVNARLLPDWQQRENASTSRLPSHSRDASLTSNTSDTPLLARTLHSNWQNRPSVVEGSSSLKAREASQHTRTHTSWGGQIVSGNLIDTTSVVGSGPSSYSDASMTRLRAEQPDEHEQVDTSDGGQAQELPPLYHTIIPDPVPSNSGTGGDDDHRPPSIGNIGIAL